MSTNKQQNDSVLQSVARETDDESQSHRITTNDSLAVSVITDQASKISHSWREMIQNGLDSPAASRVELTFDEERTICHDNGNGVDLFDEYGQRLLTELGESSKEDDDDETIGQFGMGEGQYLAKGRTAIISGPQALIFDIKHDGLNVAQVATDRLVETTRKIDGDWSVAVEEALAKHGREGFTVVVHHYPDEVPSTSYRWNRRQEEVEDRFKFAELATATKVYVDGSRISDSKPVSGEKFSYHHVEEFEIPNGGRAHVGLHHSGDSEISVYSNGVYVCDVDGAGMSGSLVTEGNLDLNFARNEIDSGCERMNAIEDRLDEVRVDMFKQIPGERLCSDARDYLARRADDLETDEFDEVKLFKTVDGDRISKNEILEKDQVLTGTVNSGGIDKLTDGLGMTVLDENDEATEGVIEKIETESADKVEMRDASEKAEEMGMHTSYERLAMGELTPVQRNKLSIARIIVEEMDGYDREVYYGKSDNYKAWTDGHSYVVITESSTSSNSWVEYVPELFRQLMHELAHETSTKEDDVSHGRFFLRNYRDIGDDQWHVLTEVLSDIRDRSLEEVVRDAPKY